MKKMRVILSTLLLSMIILFLRGKTCSAAAVTVSTFDDLKRYLKSTDSYTITLKQNITLTGEINVSGTKKVIGAGKTLKRNSTFKDGRLFDLQAGSNVEFDNVIISGNKVSASTNAIRVQEKAKLTLNSNVTIRDMVSAVGGGGVQNYGTTVTSANYYNNTSQKSGAALKNYKGGTVTIKAGTWSGNKAGTSGGALYTEEGSTCTLTGGTFKSNECTNHGRAICTNSLTVNGAPVIESNNGIYIDKANGMKITSYTTKSTKLPLELYVDKVGTQIIPGASKYINNVMWSSTFDNKQNHIIVAYNGGLYVGRYIRVTFHLEKDESCSTKYKTIKWGEAYGTLPEATRTGYVFVGWDAGKNVRPYVKPTTVVTVDSDVTLYAEWSPRVIELDFDPNGGNPMNTVWNATYDHPIRGLPTATRTGYVFVGWFDSPTGTKQYKDGDISKFTGKTMLYAHWTPIKLSITMDGNGGSVKNAKISRCYDQQLGELEVPVRKGYTFAGWSREKEKRTIVSSKTVVKDEKDFTLYAMWNVNTYTVTLNPTGGSVKSPKVEVVYDTCYNDLPTPVRTGYTFGGWYTDTKLTTRVTEKTKMSFAYNHMLYAKWTLNKYTITFDWNNAGKTITKRAVSYGQKLGRMPVPEMKDYVFAGWFDSKNGGKRYSESTVLSEAKDITLYARWESVKLVSIKVSGFKKAYNVSDKISGKSLSVTGIYNNGKKQQIKSGYTLSYTNKKAGKQKVTVSYKGIKAVVSCYWYDKKMLSKAVTSKKSLTLYSGGTSKISISKSNGINQYVSFSSSDKKVAKISKSGVITAKKSGKAEIRVAFTVNGKKTVIAVKVKVKKPELSIQWTQKGGKFYFKAKKKGCGNVVWKCSNTKVGRIDSKTGVFKARKQGTTYVYAIAGGIKKAVKIVVKNGMYECYHVS